MPELPIIDEVKYKALKRQEILFFPALALHLTRQVNTAVRKNGGDIDILDRQRERALEAVCQRLFSEGPKGNHDKKFAEGHVNAFMTALFKQDTKLNTIILVALMLFDEVREDGITVCDDPEFVIHFQQFYNLFNENPEVWQGKTERKALHIAGS